MIPYGRQSVSDEDIEALVRVLRSDFLTQGPEVASFERCVADYCGTRRAVAVSSGTAALHIACQAFDLGPGDWLWTSPVTFVASANCGRYCGAGVDFVDIDPATGNMSLPALEEKLLKARRDRKLPKILVPVHLAGLSCDMEKIRELADHFGFRVLEDASHALGATYQGKPVGSCQWSDAAVFSFHAVKMITTGEGGMVMTNDSALAERLLLLRTHGITKDAAQMAEPSHGPWYYQQLELGNNYRMTDFQAALGISQMRRLSCFVEKRQRLAARYDELLSDLPLDLPARFLHAESSWHLYIVRLHRKKLPLTQKEIFTRLQAAGVGVQLHYIPVYLQPYYRKEGFGSGDFPGAQFHYESAVTLPLHCGLTDEEQDFVCSTLRSILG